MKILCFNRNEKGKCKALVGVECSEDCFARISDPEKYIVMLEKLMVKNKQNGHMLADMRRERLAVARKFNIKLGLDAEIKEVYFQEQRRGKGGGSSEKNTNPCKPREHDNRVKGTKLTKAEREELMEETEVWEKEHGKLDVLGRGMLSRNKVDSYTGEPLE